MLPAVSSPMVSAYYIRMYVYLNTYSVCVYVNTYMHTYIWCVCVHKKLHTAYDVLSSACGAVEDQLSWRKIGCV